MAVRCSCAHDDGNAFSFVRVTLLSIVDSVIASGGVSSTRGLGPTMTARGHSIGISIGMIPQTLIVSRQGQVSRLGAQI
jgi:hypothetical protein